MLRLWHPLMRPRAARVTSVSPILFRREDWDEDFCRQIGCILMSPRAQSIHFMKIYVVCLLNRTCRRPNQPIRLLIWQISYRPARAPIDFYLYPRLIKCGYKTLWCIMCHISVKILFCLKLLFSLEILMGWKIFLVWKCQVSVLEQSRLADILDYLSHTMCAFVDSKQHKTERTFVKFTWRKRLRSFLMKELFLQLLSSWIYFSIGGRASISPPRNRILRAICSRIALFVLLPIRSVDVCQYLW